ncbi:hypothetical protein TR51_06480 [Kitasatospora griseola]|uniref:Uncharacterized protein n=1 Tax=Kitasatospora griseola TaxID=2064 RepID=A0A0D0P5Z2_KITGR|nr:hypothetical protein [Kitasatospora griseola]KIQ67031.1 hypothetical protein TR51_06480 [Kitasatospora griseola]
MNQPGQPLDLDAIQTALAAATDGTWWCDGPEIYAGQPDIPAASTNIGETLQFDLPDHGNANAVAIVATHNALPALIARVQELEQQLAATRAELERERAGKGHINLTRACTGCGHSRITHTVPEPNSCFAESCDCPTFADPLTLSAAHDAR